MTSSRSLLLLVGLLALPSAPVRADGPPAAGGPPAAAPLDDAFLPAADLRAKAFRAARPEADGRGVVVAILDTGVDPGHPRLAKTTTGERKLVDLLDATDDGFVALDVPCVVTDGQAIGATGRRVAVGAHVPPGRRAVFGRIDARDVLPTELVERVRARRRERLDQANRRAKESGGFPFTARTRESDADAATRREAEAEAREALPDESPVFDILVVETPEGPRAVLDTDADGDLGEERALADFPVAGDWVRLLDDAEFDVAVRIDANLARVRLLFDGGGHGTHVAGIVAGHDPAAPSLSGVAPGARILSIKIGNSRYGSSTTNQAIVRALDMAGRAGAAVVNISFGGPSFAGDAGSADARAVDEAAERYGLLCCLSAGNEGPLLSTVGSPASARRALSVGAFVSPATMRSSYGRLDEVPGERLFGFSSRGPLPGGGSGVHVLAPGAAWSSVPPWHLIRGDNWNGTSMAAPEVAGAAALLLSAATAERVPATLERLRRSLLASARPVPGLLRCEQGSGLVQVDRAFDVLAGYRDQPEERRLEVRVENETGHGGGIHVRAAASDADVEREVRVFVDWPTDVGNDERTAYERRLVLACDAAYVSVPPRLPLHGGGGSFPARIAVAGLAPGVHEARITGTDPARPGAGVLLEVPVTVIRPVPLDASARYVTNAVAEPGERLGWFLASPAGASSLRVRLRNGGDTRGTFTLAAGSLDQWRRATDRGADRRFELGPAEEAVLTVPVLPGAVAEVAVFSHWNSNRRTPLAVEAAFLGPASPDAELRTGPGVDVALLRLDGTLAALRADVSAVLDQVVEQPVVARAVAPDPVGGSVFGGDLLFVATQRFALDVRDGETATVVPLGDAALDEVREDARWRILDGASRVVRKAVVDGPFDLAGLPAGRYVVEYETPAWRRAGADAGTTGFEVRRSLAPLAATVHGTADAAAERRDASGRVEWPRGAVRSVALRLPDLEAGRLYRGRVEVRVDGDLRLTLPLVADRRTTEPPDVAAAESALIAAASATARGILADPDASLDARREALGKADRARSLRPDDLALEELALRAVVALAEDPAARAEAVARANVFAPRLTRTRAEHRGAMGRVHLARAVVARHDGKPSDADWSEARFLLPEDDADVLAERVARGLAAGGDPKDALAAARLRRDRRSTSFAAHADVVRLAAGLGWGIVAAKDVRGLRDRFPTRRREIEALEARVREVGADPAPRTLSAITEGAP